MEDYNKPCPGNKEYLCALGGTDKCQHAYESSDCLEIREVSELYQTLMDPKVTEIADKFERENTPTILQLLEREHTI